MSESSSCGSDTSERLVDRLGQSPRQVQSPLFLEINNNDFKENRKIRIESAPGVPNLFTFMNNNPCCLLRGRLFLTRDPDQDLMNTKVWKWKMVHMPSNALIHWSMVFPNSNNTCGTRHLSIQSIGNQMREATAKMSERLVPRSQTKKVLLSPNWLHCCVF